MAAILPDVIVFVGRNGRIIFVIATPGIPDIKVKRVAITVEFPHSGDRHSAPGGIVECYGFETLGAKQRGVVKTEFPQAVKALRQLLVSGKSSCHRQAVFLEYSRVLPVLQGGGGQCQNKGK